LAAAALLVRRPISAASRKMVAASSARWKPAVSAVRRVVAGEQLVGVGGRDRGEDRHPGQQQNQRDLAAPGGEK
jgi:hypothetical protein